MAFTADCPFCHLMLQNVPDQHAGASIECPRCRSSFTLAAMAGSPVLHAHGSRLGTKSKSASLAAAPSPGFVTGAGPPVSVDDRPPAPAPFIQRDGPPTTAVQRGPTAEPIAELAPAFPSVGTKAEPALAAALIGITLAGLSLLLSQAPYGRIGSVVLAGLGLLLGLASLGVAARKRLVPCLATTINAAVLLVVIAIPSWLGLSSWWPAAIPDDSRTIKAVRHKSGGASKPAEWVDASKESWRQGDVLVSVRAASIEPVQLTGPQGKKQTKEPYLQIWLRVTNEGFVRKFEFTGWDASEPSTVPRLTDFAGRSLPPKTFEPGWEPPGRPSSVAVFPGKWTENLLIFAAPPPVAGDLRLELPGSAFGSSETVRLILPQAWLSSRRTKKLETEAQ